LAFDENAGLNIDKLFIHPGNSCSYSLLVGMSFVTRYRAYYARLKCN